MDIKTIKIARRNADRLYRVYQAATDAADAMSDENEEERERLREISEKARRKGLEFLDAAFSLPYTAGSTSIIADDPEFWRYETFCERPLQRSPRR